MAIIYVPFDTTIFWTVIWFGFAGAAVAILLHFGRMYGGINPS